MLIFQSSSLYFFYLFSSLFTRKKFRSSDIDPETFVELFVKNVEEVYSLKSKDKTSSRRGGPTNLSFSVPEEMEAIQAVDRS